MFGVARRVFWSSLARRTATVSVAIIVTVSVVGSSLPQKALAVSTVGTSSSASATASIAQRTTVESSNGTTLTVYQAGTESPSGLSYRTSTDDASNWSSGTQIDSSTSTDFSIVIDGSDHVYVVWADSGTVKIRKLTYSGGSWSVGSSNTALAFVTCVTSTVDGESYSRPVVAITTSGKVWVSALMARDRAIVSCPGASLYHITTTSSTNLSSWTDNAATISVASTTYGSMVGRGDGIWMMLSGYGLYADISGSGTFVRANSTNLVTSNPISMSYGLDELLFFYKNGSNNLVFRKYTISDATLSSETTISSATSDIAGTISTDSYNHWVMYQSYVGANSYNVVFKQYNGSSWDVSSTAVTSDNANNVLINSPARIPNTVSVPIVWNVGTGSPYTVKAHSVSTMGTATDSGNTSGSYSGSLTGSSGDQIVKSGVWYYSTINIVNGMTIRVLASDGVTGGSLEINGATVTVAGTINGSSRGYPGGAGLVGIGGTGGNRGSASTSTMGNSGTAGSAGTSYAGAAGSGTYGSSGGSAGTNAPTGGAQGTGRSNLGGNPGSGGDGDAATAGTSASTIAGYLGAGINGDSSIDTSGAIGSGGGSGGSGGSGAGGGGGASGAGTGTLSGGQGGIGGAGAAGGYGGKGGNGGALIKIFSTGSMTVSGTITATGEAGVSGQSGQSGTNGGSGSTGCTAAC